ncbi:MAG: hypothetical protein ACR2I1_05675, partial [Propionibacteriaceae bacterium]
HLDLGSAAGELLPFDLQTGVRVQRIRPVWTAAFDAFDLGRSILIVATPPSTCTLTSGLAGRSEEGDIPQPSGEYRVITGALRFKGVPSERALWRCRNPRTPITDREVRRWRNRQPTE